jgi:hypothetical protein
MAEICKIRRRCTAIIFWQRYCEKCHSIWQTKQLLWVKRASFSLAGKEATKHDFYNLCEDSVWQSLDTNNDADCDPFPKNISESKSRWSSHNRKKARLLDQVIARKIWHPTETIADMTDGIPFLLLHSSLTFSLTCIIHAFVADFSTFLAGFILKNQSK